jgi:hypothetical protein
MFSSPTPEQKAAAAADRAASRGTIEDAKKTITTALNSLKVDSAKEDYEPAKKLYKDGLDWLKAHPTASPDDIKDYMTNLTSAPLLQSLRFRGTYYMYLNIVQNQLDRRMKELEEKNPSLLPAAKELADPAIAYRDTIKSWLEQGRMTLLPDDYKDKTNEIQEKTIGLDGKEDHFQINAFFDNKQLQSIVVSKQAEENTINIPRLLGKIAKYLGIALLLVILCWGGFLGACYSTNLNLYRSFEFRLFYAIYGALFWIFVVPYELVYRKWWLGETAELHGYIPLVEGPLETWSWVGKTFFFFLERKPMVNMTA